MRLQSTALDFYRAGKGKELSTLLEQNGMLDENLKVYFNIAFGCNGTADFETTDIETEFDEAVLEALLPMFDTDRAKVLSKTHILHDSTLSMLECERIAKAVFGTRRNQEKWVLPFIVPEQPECYSGMITSQMFQEPRKIRLVEVFQVIGKEGLSYTMKYLGENIERRGGKYLRSEHAYAKPFWLFKFEDAEQHTYVLLSKKRLEPGYCKIKGCPIQIRDVSGIGESANLPSDITLFYVTEYTADNAKITKDEYDKTTRDWNHNSMAQMILGEFRHPVWFEKLILAFLFGGEYNNFPLHLVWVSKPGCGKTMVLQSLQTVYKEIAGVYDGAGSTFKGLVPSFGGSMPSEGYVAKVRRLGLIDEFLTGLMRATDSRGVANSDHVGQMTSLMDHTVSTVASGRHQAFEVRSKGRLLFATNPKLNLRTMSEVSTNLNGAFVSRALWYFMTPQHADFIQKNKVNKTILATPFPKPSEFVKVADYMTSFSLDLDGGKVAGIVNRLKELVPLAALESFDGRAPHHVACMIDGVAKYNTVIEHRPKATINKSDYVEAEGLLTEVVSTWTDSIQSVNQLPVKIRKTYIPLRDRELFDVIDKSASITMDELRKALPEWTKDDFDYHLGKLSELGLAAKVGDKWFAHWHRDLKEVKL
jgi:hypothetical protein